MTNRPAPGGNAANNDICQKIIQDDQHAELLVTTANQLGQKLAKLLTTSQIRAIYGEVLRIKADWLESGNDAREARARRALTLLRPKLAYRAKKEKGQGVEELKQVLDPAMAAVRNKEDFQRFCEFFEAILAYHKAHGGN